MIKGLPKVEEMYDGTGYQGGNIYRKRTFSEWEEWFAWRPVKVKGKRVWLKKVFRRCINTYVDHDDWKRYEYGTAFDVIRNDSSNY